MVQDWVQEYLDFCPFAPIPVFVAYASAQSPGQRLVEVLNPLTLCGEKWQPLMLVGAKASLSELGPIHQSRYFFESPSKKLGTIKEATRCIPPNPQSFLNTSTTSMSSPWYNRSCLGRCSPSLERCTSFRGAPNMQRQAWQAKNADSAFLGQEDGQNKKRKNR